MGTQASNRRISEEIRSVGQPVVDLVHLSRQSMGDRALEGELLGLFARQARSVLETLTTASAGGELPHWGCEPLHMLTGSARAVGCWMVGEQAEVLEREIRAAALERSILAVENRLEPLISAVEAACGAIADLLADQH